MADSAFWHALAEDFAKLPAQGIFVRWQYTSGRPGRYTYTIRGASQRLQLTFEQLVRKAGAALDERGEKDPLEDWLHELRKHDKDPRNQREPVGPEVLNDGTKVFHQLGEIPNASELSAGRCIELAKLKMEAEPRSKGGHRGREEATRKRGRRPNQERRDAIRNAIIKHGDKWRDQLSNIYQELDTKEVFLGVFQGRKIDLGDGQITNVEKWDHLDFAQGKQRKQIIDTFRKYVD